MIRLANGSDRARHVARIHSRFDLITRRRRARSTTPVRGPLHLTSNRERLLVSLSQSEADIAQITQQLSSVKDVLTKLKFVRTRRREEGSLFYGVIEVVD